MLLHAAVASLSKICTVMMLDGRAGTPLYPPSAEVTACVSVRENTPSTPLSTPSSVMVTVTVWGMFQLPVVKVREPGAAASVPSCGVTLTSTSAVGSVSSTTL